jgi:hypothetical protein
VGEECNKEINNLNGVFSGVTRTTGDQKWSSTPKIIQYINTKFRSYDSIFLQFNAENCSVKVRIGFDWLLVGFSGGYFLSITKAKFRVHKNRKFLYNRYIVCIQSRHILSYEMFYYSNILRSFDHYHSNLR